MTRSFRSAAAAVAWRNVHSFFTNPAVLVPASIFPLFFFTAFAGGLSRIDSVPGFHFAPGYTAFEYAFVVLQSAAFGGVFTGFSVARDFEMGFSRRLFLAAGSRRAVLFGYVLAGLSRAVYAIAVVTVIAFAVGMNVYGDGLDLLGLYTLALLMNLAAVLFGTGVAMRMRTFQAAPAMQIPVFLSLFLAPVYVPVDLLSGWVHAVASVNPISAVLEAGRGFLAGAPDKTAVAFLALGAMGAAFLAWALRGLRAAERAT